MSVGLPEAVSVFRPTGRAVIPIVAGAVRLTFSGPSPGYHDLHAVYGIELEVVTP